MVWRNRRQFLRQLLLSPLLLIPAKFQTESQTVAFIWSGGITATSAQIKARLWVDSQRVRLLVSLNEKLSQPFASKFFTASLATNNRLVTFAPAGLQPNTQYYYALEVDGNIDWTHRGKFKTFPQGPASFSVAFGSCAETNSAHPIFETIRGLAPLFFVHLGDMHYQNIGVNDRNAYRQAYETVLSSPTQSALYRDVPIVYTWDDHDYGRNDSDSQSISRTAARLTYQEYVPHYPLVAGSGDVPIYQAFTVGRVRFILTDLRSERSPRDDPDTAAKTLLGTAQKQWLKYQLLYGMTDFALTIWLSGVAWIPNLSDGWHRYSTERREIADLIAGNVFENIKIRNLIMLTGDLHIMGIDDGSNSGFGSTGGNGFPVMQASPLDQFGFSDGLPFATYSEGAVAERGQFGLLTVEDEGGQTITVTLSGRNAANQELMSYRFMVDVEQGLIPPTSRNIDKPQQGLIY